MAQGWLQSIRSFPTMHEFLCYVVSCFCSVGDEVEKEQAWLTVLGAS
jgi:hypothetical protein